MASEAVGRIPSTSLASGDSARMSQYLLQKGRRITVMERLAGVLV